MSLVQLASLFSPAKVDRLRVFIRERRRVLIRTAIVIAILIVIRLLIPPLIERGVAYGSRYYLGLPARIDKVELSLLKGKIALEGVNVASVPDQVTPLKAALNPPLIDPSSALFHCQRISVRLAWLSLLKKTARFTEVSIDSPSVHLLREEGGLIDPLSHAKPLSPPPKKENKETVKAPEKPSSKPWAIVINQFALRSPNLLILDPALGKNLLEFSLQQFTLEDLSVRGSDLGLGAVGIQGTVLRVQKDLLLAGQSAGGTAPKASSKTTSTQNSKTSADSSALGYRVKKIDIAHTKFTWITKEGPLDVIITLKASNVTADQGKTFPISLALEIANGTIGLDGDVGILPPSYSGKFTWSNLPFPPLLLASLPEMAAWLRSADSSGELRIDTDIPGFRGPPSIRISGRSTIESLSISDPGNKELSVGWKQLEVVMNEAVIPIPNGAKSLPATKLDFALIRLVDPKINYTHPATALNALLGSSSSTNASNATSASMSNPPSPPSSGSSPVEAKIAQLELTGGSIEVNNTTVQPTAVSTVSGLSISLQGVNYPDPSVDKISIQAILPTNSMLSIDGTLKPGNVGSYTVSLKSLDLPPFSPYAGAAGASLDSGQISVTTKLNTQGSLMQIDSDLVLNSFGISLRDPSSFTRMFGVPIDLTIALLSDPSGDIKLTVPLRVDEKGSTVSFGPVIASALKSAILGAISTPLKLLGGSFGGKSASSPGTFSITPIKSPAGSPDLDSSASGRVEGLVKLLAQRPAMGLMLRGRTSTDDRPLVAEQLLFEQLKQGKGLPELEGTGFLDHLKMKQILSKRNKDKSASISVKDQPLFDRYLAAVQIPEDRLDTLARLRAEKVRDMLVAKGVNAARISIGNREAVGEGGVVISFLPQRGSSSASK
jgi:uncharacterized protein involved in outer membrane biogenesis